MVTHRDVAKQLGLTIIPSDDLTIVRDGKALLDAIGAKVSKTRAAQIDKLVIPPAWKDVRFAPKHNHHIQAIGTDADGRRQYIYHEDWVDVREQVKGERLYQFGQSLPAIRAKVESDLKKPANSRRGAMAVAIRLIDNQLVRAGHEKYAANGTRGAATLLNKNVIVKNGEVALKYDAKSGQKAKIVLKDPALKRRVRKLKKRGGRRLLSTKRGGRPINASHLNRYLNKAAGRKVSLKDFRTFRASALALSSLCEHVNEATKSTIPQTMKKVATILRNTPAVTRSSYIHPPIIEDFESGKLSVALIKGRKRERLSREETALMRFLEDHR